MADLLDRFHVWDALQRIGDVVSSRALLEALALQLAIIAAVFLLAWALRAATRSATDRLAERIQATLHIAHLPTELRRLVVFAYAWLLLVVAERAAAPLLGDSRLVHIVATLTGLWIVLRASSLLLRDAVLARIVATLAWIIAALDLFGLLAPATAALDSLALTVGTVRLSVLLVVKAVLIVTVLLWAALGIARIVASRLEHFAGLSPSVQVLIGNLIKILLVVVALLIGLDMVGIDLTAFAVFSGAIGVGVGFGLQKIVSNFVSGIILLLERSIKPGDVIEVGSTHGSVTSLGARYSSVRGRDGKEYLIPNESLITNPVVNWSYSSPQVRLDAEFGVGYGSDLHQVRALAIETAKATKRVLAAPEPVCHVTGFGDSAVNLLLRFWIDDPKNGVVNIKGDVFLALWDAFHEHDIELPFPLRDLRIKEVPPEWLTRPGPEPRESRA